MSEVAVRSATPADRTWVAEVAKLRLGSNVQAVRGGLFTVSHLPALIAETGGGRAGFLAWEIRGDVCEVMALASVTDGAGVGRALLEAVRSVARERWCREVRVVTTGDNARARRLYERHGYEVVEFRPGAVDRARATVKPEIPEHIHDEVEYRRAV